jgi:hypothetical protein
MTMPSREIAMIRAGPAAAPAPIECSVVDLYLELVLIEHLSAEFCPFLAPDVLVRYENKVGMPLNSVVWHWNWLWL